MVHQILPTSCDALFQPITIKGMTIPNRIVMPPMHLNYTTDGHVSDQLINFYKERAAGGAGLIVIGGCSVDMVGSGSFMIGARDDSFLPGLRKFVDEMKKANPEVKLGAQLYHAGRYAMSFLTGHQPVSSTAHGSRFNPETPRALELDEIPQVQQVVADAALRLKNAGFDTVEVLGSAGYLISQFLSPATNKRTDEYGGSFENRLRFGVETIEKTRAAVGPDYPIMMRIAGADFVPGGHTNKESAEACVHFEKAGIDLFNVTGGWHESRVPQLTMGVPRATYTYLAHGIKKKVNVPVIACNRINDPRLGEHILRQGIADMIGFARGLIADAELPQKAKEGKFHLIRKCIACNQGCFDHVFLGIDVNCLVNFRVGRETLYPEIEKTDSPKNVLVIGGGPAGCEAARVAAIKGHKVTLLEKTDRLGGALHLCAAPHGRDEFNELINFFTNSLKDLNVDVRLNTLADAETVDELKPDAVVVSHGAKAIIPPFMKDAKMDNVFLAEDVLLGKKVCYGDTVVIGGGAVGCETAIMLAHQGMMEPEIAAFLIESNAETAESVKEMLSEPIRNVAIVEMLGKVGEDIGKSTRWTLMLDLRRSKVEINKLTTVLSIEKEGVLVKDEKDNERLIPCSNAIVAVGYRSDKTLAETLEEKGYEVHVAGDANSPRMAINAIEEGFKVGWKL